MKTEITLEKMAQQLGLTVEEFDGFYSISALVEGADGSRVCGVDYYPADVTLYEWQDNNGLLSSGTVAQQAAVYEMMRQIEASDDRCYDWMIYGPTCPACGQAFTGTLAERDATLMALDDLADGQTPHYAVPDVD